jgi:O-methyltransferase involved in polyketide biosynthesis
MNSVNKTLYIPLYGKALVSSKNIILQDKKAEEIWQSQAFKLKGKSKSKWLAYFMSMRAVVFDSWTKEKIRKFPNAIVLHLGCGLDSRVLRVDNKINNWYDVDFNSVITERKKYYQETALYHMLSGDISKSDFIKSLPDGESAIIILEGVSMYLPNGQLAQTLLDLGKKYKHLSVLVDCYTPFAVKMSKIKNPIKDVGASKVYGVESPSVFEKDTNLTFIKEHLLTPQYLIDHLKGFEKFIFKTIYAGKTSKKLYKLYEYKTKE